MSDEPTDENAIDETDGDFDPNDPNEFGSEPQTESLFGETSLFDAAPAPTDAAPAGGEPDETDGDFDPNDPNEFAAGDDTGSLFGEGSLFSESDDAPVDPNDISQFITTGASFFADGTKAATPPAPDAAEIAAEAAAAEPVEAAVEPEPEAIEAPSPEPEPEPSSESAPAPPPPPANQPQVTGPVVRLEGLPDPWEGVLGQADATARLEQAADDPVHAYMLMGSKGSGSFEAALGFAGLLLSTEAEMAGDAVAATRHRRLAKEAGHPDLVLIEAAGQSLMVADAEEIIRQASTSPVEGKRKVIVVRSVEIINEATIGKLLKIVEEPPPTAIFVLLAEEVTPEIVTIASRCVPVDFAPVSIEVIEADLIARGVDPARATDAALASGGDVARARLLATDEALADRAALWKSLPDRLNGTGAAVFELTAQLRERMDDAQTPLEIVHTEQLDVLQERIDLTGERGSGKKELIEKQKREIRRQRTDEIRFGLATLARVYRDRLVHAADPQAETSLAAIQHTAEALIRNPNEPLLLQSLLLELSPRR